LHGLVRALEVLNLLAFVGLALLSVRLWLRRRDRATFCAMLAFAAIAVVSVIGRIAPQHPSGLVDHTLVRLDVAILVVFPYLLFRFATAFDPPSSRITRICAALTTALVLWTFALPHFPEQGEPWGAVFVAYLVVFLVYWTALSAVAARRLWRAGRGQPGVARRRMRLLAVATGVLTLALFLAVGAGDSHYTWRALTQAAAFLSVIAFALGLAPPRLLRYAWRGRENRRLTEAIESLVLLATSREEIVQRVLGPTADIVGASAVELRDADGNVLGRHRADGPPEGDAEEIEVRVPGGTVVVWTTRYAPFFGESELELVRTLGTMTNLALDRVRLFVQEREARVGLQRANDVMANFVALAAHELRTPITSIHGFVHTLNHLGDRLTAEQRAELSTSLEQQTIRMAALVEQLLDLSQLDADAVEIAPERFRVRDRISDLVGAAAAERVEAVTVDVHEELEAEADPHAFDRIVTNLITNAFRYGEPPVTIRAEHSGDKFRVLVEDRGHGVPHEFVPDLFERFSRSETSRARAAGTGLGLAIARSYARAHGGDLVYEPASPQGARFKLVLPSS
jgi:signal transduction histidine kinase